MEERITSLLSAAGTEQPGEGALERHRMIEGEGCRRSQGRDVSCLITTSSACPPSKYEYRDAANASKCSDLALPARISMASNAMLICPPDGLLLQEESSKRDFFFFLSFFVCFLFPSSRGGKDGLSNSLTNCWREKVGDGKLVGEASKLISGKRSCKRGELAGTPKLE